MSQLTPAPIRVLPSALMNQIAAGEVVERPASVIKELVENSLDAGASKIEASIEHGGRGLILVADNGHGIVAEELELAVTRHATNKISEVADLTAILSFGFRGEAMPSIGSVSRMTVTSVTENHDAWFIRVESGEVVEQGPAALAAGTRVEVADLFISVPARLKFLKTEATETRRCQDVVMRMALANPEAAFSFTTNGRQIFSLPQGQTLADRLAAFWPPAICSALLPVDRVQGDYAITGLAGSPATAQGRASRILLFVNGRPVQDKLLLSAVRQAYSGRLLSKEYPQILLFLTLPPDRMDVNVHPAKQEVRFAEESAVFTTVRQGLLHALVAADPLPSGGPDSLGERPFSGLRESSSGAPGSLSGGAWNSGPLAHPPASTTNSLSMPSMPNTHTAGQHNLGSDDYSQSTATMHAPSAPSAIKQVGGLDYLGQVADTYLIIRSGDKLMLVDQHAAHERVLLAAMRRERNKGDSQPLAMPLELALHPSESTKLQELWNELRQAGFLLETEGVATLRVTGIPPTLDTARAVEYLRAAVSDQAKNLDDLWAMLSCKSAIKAGQPLADDEALALLEIWLETPEREYCPHGRPVVISWSPRELEKLFKRTG